jgi:DNA-binding HxlR family transcriptional regulator
VSGFGLKEGTPENYTHLMVTVDDMPNASFCAGMTEAEDEAAREVLERISGKWPLAVLQVLGEAQGPLRFSRVLERTGPVSQKVLTQTLRMLERDGFLTRTLYPQVPPRVEYELTPLGQGLLLEILPLWRWIVGRLQELARNRTMAAEPEVAGSLLPAAGSAG